MAYDDYQIEPGDETAAITHTPCGTTFYPASSTLLGFVDVAFDHSRECVVVTS